MQRGSTLEEQNVEKATLQSIQTELRRKIGLLDEAEALQDLMASKSSLELSNEQKSLAAQRLQELYGNLAAFDEDKSAEESKQIAPCEDDFSGPLKFLMETVFFDIFNLGIITHPVYLPDGKIYQEELIKEFLGHHASRICPQNQDISFSLEDIIPCKTLKDALKIITDKTIPQNAAIQMLFDQLCKDPITKNIIQNAVLLNGTLYDRQTAEDLLEKLDPSMNRKIIPCHFVGPLIKHFDALLIEQKPAEKPEEKSEEKPISQKDKLISEIRELLLTIQNPQEILLVNKDMEIVLEEAIRAIESDDRTILLEAIKKHPGYNKIITHKTMAWAFCIFHNSVLKLEVPPGKLVGEKIQETIVFFSSLIPKPTRGFSCGL